ncbi:hypothetical protein GCM10023317_00200 [Actinopolymorpha pittospori]
MDEEPCRLAPDPMVVAGKLSSGMGPGGAGEPSTPLNMANPLITDTINVYRVRLCVRSRGRRRSAQAIRPGVRYKWMRKGGCLPDKESAGVVYGLPRGSAGCRWPSAGRAVSWHPKEAVADLLSHVRCRGALPA